MYPLSHNYVILIIEIVAPNFNLTVNARICTRFHHGCYSGQFVCITFVYLITASDDVVWYQFPVEYQWTETAVITHPNLYIESFKGRRYGQSYNTTNVLLLLYRIWCSVFYLQNTLYFENKNLHGDFSQEGISMWRVLNREIFASQAL